MAVTRDDGMGDPRRCHPHPRVASGRGEGRPHFRVVFEYNGDRWNVSPNEVFTEPEPPLLRDEMAEVMIL